MALKLERLYPKESVGVDVNHTYTLDFSLTNGETADFGTTPYFSVDGYLDESSAFRTCAHVPYEFGFEDTCFREPGAPLYDGFLPLSFAKISSTPS